MGSETVWELGAPQPVRNVATKNEKLKTKNAKREEDGRFRILKFSFFIFRCRCATLRRAGSSRERSLFWRNRVAGGSTRVGGRQQCHDRRVLILLGHAKRREAVRIGQCRRGARPQEQRNRFGCARAGGIVQ